MSDALEIKLRTDSLNDKLTYAAEAQSVLRQLLTEVSVLYLCDPHMSNHFNVVIFTQS